VLKAERFDRRSRVRGLKERDVFGDGEQPGHESRPHAGMVRIIQIGQLVLAGSAPHFQPGHHREHRLGRERSA